jgi:hypothetical protein
MIFASAHGHPAPAFNGLFYATAATVIPVLFLAVGVQGPIFAQVIRAYQALAHPAPGEERPFRHAVPVFALATNAVRILMVIVLVAAACGELLALISLYLQSDIAGTGLLVLLSVGFLTLAAGGAPAGAFVGVLIRTRKQNTGQDHATGEGDRQDQQADHEASPLPPDAGMPGASAPSP